MSEWQQGAKYVRDRIICNIIGLQNANGNDIESIEYKTLQKVSEVIEYNFGEYMKPVK